MSPNPQAPLDDEELYKGPDFEKEKLIEITETGPGYYTGVVGRLQHVETEKFLGKILDIFLVNKRAEHDDNATPEAIMRGSTKKDEPGIALLEFRKDKDGNYMTGGCITKLRFPIIEESMSRGAKYIHSLNRKMIGSVFNAISTENEIDWNKIRDAMGTFIKFDMKKDKSGKWLNIDLESMVTVPQFKVGPKNVTACYDVYDQVKRGYSSTDSTPEPAPF